MSDAHLTDHEWRLKMAAEGKAIYIPGKTPEQIRAEQAAKAEYLAQTSSRTISLTNGEWQAIDTAIPDLDELFHDLEIILSELAYAADLDSNAVRSMLRLAGVAIKGMEEKEMLAIGSLDRALRRARQEELS